MKPTMRELHKLVKATKKLLEEACCKANNGRLLLCESAEPTNKKKRNR